MVALLVFVFELGLCGTRAWATAAAKGQWPIAQTGYATWVTPARDGDESASGELFEGRKLVAAHRTLPWGSIVRVVNLQNDRAVTVRVIDRGPYGRNARHGAIVDLSRAAARRLRMVRHGKVLVRLVVLRVGTGRRVHR